LTSLTPNRLGFPLAGLIEEAQARVAETRRTRGFRNIRGE
jgi:hypothetical protein